jgi:hypothetical protein
MRVISAGLAGGLVAALLAAGGCAAPDDKNGAVSGTVRLDGEPIKEGSIAFAPKDGKGQTSGGPIKDGQYTVNKVSVGVMKVRISAPVVKGQKKVEGPGGPNRAVMEEKVPPRYNDQTELEFEVKPGTNEHNFDLKSK